MRARFHRADRLHPPDIWNEVLRRAAHQAPPGRASRSRATVRVGLALVATLLLAVVAIAAFGALLRTPHPDPTQSVEPSASEVPSPIASPLADDLSSWHATGEMVYAPAEAHTVTLLSDGRVLVATSSVSELFDPNEMTWTRTGSMVESRASHSATRLADGRVLVAGGLNSLGDHAFASAELFDASTGTWTATGPMAHARGGHTATLLMDGRVLVAGGNGVGADLASAEIYDPGTGTWSETGSMQGTRDAHTATLLRDGNVLVAGGGGTAGSRTAELFDPIAGAWTLTGDMVEARTAATATLLTDGRVLVAGGWTLRASAEVFDPSTGSWMATGPMNESRAYFTATLLPDGRVLAAGGGDGGYGGSSSAELYDPISGSWVLTRDMRSRHGWHSASPLADGRVLIVGGFGQGKVAQPAAEVYQLDPTHDVTLWAGGCVARAAGDLVPGSARLTLLNSAGTPANFELLRISSFNMFDQFLAEARRRIAAGEPPPEELPLVEEELDRERLEPGRSGELTGSLTAGVYAVVCVVLTESDDIVTVYGVGPYRVPE